ncbi:MAG: glutamine synthetase [Halioglobus sp.]|nr:glutamine synthetase [Halioglobus sp.]
MNARDVKTAADARAIVEARNLAHVKVGVFDNDGILRGKYMSRDKFLAALDKGFGFCDVVLGWDCQDQLYDNAAYTGWHTGYPDAPVRILPDTCRELPLEEGAGLLFLAEFDGAAAAVCPRNTLRRVLQRAADMGYSARAALEYEFFLFEETPHSLREKDYRDLKPITPGWFGYSVLNNSVHAGLYARILELAQAMDFPLEGLHEESGPGVIEAAITVDDALAAADKAALFKTFIKVLAQQHGLMATFMARWSPDYPGQSGHVHLSLRGAEDAAVFHDAACEHNMSDTQRHFLAGQQRLMAEFLALVAPTVNSYTRLVPGFWAPDSASWGVENRTTALRLIPGGPAAQRIEYRIGSADSNPYLALAAALGSGLAGIAGGWEPTAAVSGSAYEMQHPEALTLPRTLWDAAQRLQSSDTARDLFGDAFVDHFGASREWEEREFRRHISDWELRRYFDII